MMSYVLSSVNMLPDAIHNGKIIKSNVWNNPNGPDKLICEIELTDGTIFSHFFAPGFSSAFEDLLRSCGIPVNARGTFDEKLMIGKCVTFETKISTASNGNDYCNVTWVKPGPETITNPNATQEELEAMNPFAEEDKKKA